MPLQLTSTYKGLPAIVTTRTEREGFVGASVVELYVPEIVLPGEWINLDDIPSEYLVTVTVPPGVSWPVEGVRTVPK